MRREKNPSQKSSENEYSFFWKNNTRREDKKQYTVKDAIVPNRFTFGEDEVYNQADAEGFINLFGLPLMVNALMKENLK